MVRILLILQLYWCTCCVLGVVVPVGRDEPPDAKLQKLSDDSRARAEGMQVRVALGDRTTKATLRPNPIMKYTDVPREIEMATLWVWQDEGRPVALEKVEAYQGPGGSRWLYCFASTSSGLVEGQWADGRPFKAGKPGIEWKALDGPVPQETAAGRLRQLKALFRRFSALPTKDGKHETDNELRPLPQPLLEYSSPKQGVIQGVWFAFVGNGTNPYAIVALEAVSPGKGKDTPNSWRYGVVGITASAAAVKLDKAEVAHVVVRQAIPSPSDFEKGTFFWEGAPPVK